ncbi:MAG: hypothetical protein H0T41_03165 [Rhodobacteraceae bacterium]|nr:hypothetical protein [Paracoccaceae bacterium]
MRRLAIVLFLGALQSVLLGACAADGPPQTLRMRACDDGGSGGVVIEGVCL